MLQCRTGDNKFNDEKYLDIILRSMDVVVWSASFPELELLHVSSSSEKIFGADLWELANKENLWYQHVHPDDMDIVESAAKQRKNQEVVSTEYRIIRPDGEIRWVCEHSEIIRDEHNAPLHVEGIIKDITRQKMAEEELCHREDRLRSLLSILQYSSDSAQDFLDFALDEAIKLTRSKIGYIYYYNEQHKEFILNTWSKDVMKECAIAKPQSVYKLENTGIWGEAVRQRKTIIVNDFQSPNSLKKGYPEGHVELYRYMTVPVFKNGQTVAVVGVANKGSDYDENDKLQLILLMDSLWNIVEQKKTEDALQKSEKRYRQAYNILQGLIESPEDVVIFALDTNYRYLTFNRNHLATMQHIWGANIEIGTSILDCIKDPVDREKAKVNFDRALAGEAFTLIEEYGDSSLNRCWYSNMYSPLKDSEGNVIGLTLILTDITERKRAEELLRKSEERHRILARNSSDVIWTMDINGRFTYVSPSVEKLRGYTPEEVMEQKPEEFLSPDSLQHYLMGIESTREIVMKGESFPPQRLELEQPCKDGSTVLTEAIISGMYNEAGEFVGILGVSRDITERKELEKNLIIEKERAQEATRAKSEFLANMSHEIRTPMNGVIGMTGLLLDTELTDEQRHYAEVVKFSGESLLEIINDILDFSKIEAGKLELETVDFDLHAMLGDFSSMLSVRAHEKELEFICAAAPDVPTYVRGDPGRLQQVLMNLTGNAIKFTQKGEVVVSVSLESETDDEAHLRFSIRDTGIGIPESKKENLFNKFYQVDTSTTRQFGGTGLGLAISKQLVEMMGGNIDVESEVDKGSEFWFTINLSRQSESEHEEIIPAGIQDAHILVIDDNATNREIINKRLSSWGARVKEAADGLMGLQAMYSALESNDPFRVVILDMHMPGMDGGSVANAIKSDYKLKSTPLLMLSSLGQPSDSGYVKEGHFAACLTKPVRYQELFRVLSNVLSREEQRQNLHKLKTAPSASVSQQVYLRILLAEDNIVNQKVAQSMLQKMGHRVDTVANGEEAIKALEMLPYDLVFMDVQMPEMDGLEATRHIRDPDTLVLNHVIPVIAMTAHAMKGDKERCLESGMDDYIAKPLSLQSLMELMVKWQNILEKGKERNTSFEGNSVHNIGEQVFDRQGLLEKLMGDEDLARRLIGIFLEDIPKQMDALRESIANVEADQISWYVHKIKGSSANIGGMALSAVAAEMEVAGRENRDGEICSMLAELEKQYDLLATQLRDI